jgi:hypothetical protein
MSFTKEERAVSLRRNDEERAVGLRRNDEGALG